MFYLLTILCGPEGVNCYDSPKTTELYVQFRLAAAVCMASVLVFGCVEAFTNTRIYLSTS